jgi:AcrR family transcriptional regulator
MTFIGDERIFVRMERADPFEGEPADTREAIMRATYRALRRHGYADLSIAHIADEAGLSKSSFYNHFDGKDDLLLAFLEFMLDRFESAFAFEETDDPVADLRRAVTVAIVGDPIAGTGGTALAVGDDELPPGHPLSTDATKAPFVELRAHAVHDPDYRERYTRVDDAIRDRLATILRRGQAEGVVREDADPDRAADVLLSLFVGTIARGVTSEGMDVEAIKDEVDDLLDRYLLVEE